MHVQFGNGRLLATTLVLCNTPNFSSMQVLQQKNKKQWKNLTDLCYEMLFYKSWPAPSTQEAELVFYPNQLRKLKMHKRDPT